MTHPASDAAVAVALAVGVAAALVETTYRPLRHVVTVVHEAGHALIALLCGRRLRSIRLNRDSSGETVSVGRSRGLGVVLTLLAGYPAPSLVGLGGFWAVTHEKARAWVIVAALVLCAVLLMLRNAFGVLVLGASIAGLYALTRPGAQLYVVPAVLAVSAFLLVAGFRNCLELWRNASRPDDAQALRRATGVAAGVWRLVFSVAAFAALAQGAWEMFRLMERVSSG